MFSALLLTFSVVALLQFGVFYWRALMAGEAAQPVSQQVLEAAHVNSAALRGEDYRSLAQLHTLTPSLSFGGKSRRASLGLVPIYYKLIRAIGAIAEGRMAAVAAWAEGEQALCARYAAVQVERRLQANLALAASMRSC